MRQQHQAGMLCTPAAVVAVCCRPGSCMAQHQHFRLVTLYSPNMQQHAHVQRLAAAACRWCMRAALKVGASSLYQTAVAGFVAIAVAGQENGLESTPGKVSSTMSAGGETWVEVSSSTASRQGWLGAAAQLEAACVPHAAPDHLGGMCCSR